MSKKQTPKVGDLVEVYYLDHSTRDVWTDKAEGMEVIECRYVGWVDRIDAQVLQLYANETDRERVSQHSLTLRKCITRLTVLKRATTAAPKWTKK